MLKGVHNCQKWVVSSYRCLQKMNLNGLRLYTQGNFHCLQYYYNIIQLSDTIEKQQAILSHFQGYIQNRCDRCEYMITNLAMQCAQENSEVVALRAKLFSPLTDKLIDKLASLTGDDGLTCGTPIRCSSHQAQLLTYLQPECTSILQQCINDISHVMHSDIIVAQTCLFMWFTHGQLSDSCFAQAALFCCSSK